jgi:hypothetical protein
MLQDHSVTTYLEQYHLLKTTFEIGTEVLYMLHLWCSLLSSSQPALFLLVIVQLLLLQQQQQQQQLLLLLLLLLTAVISNLSSLVVAEKLVYHSLLYNICQRNFLNHHELLTA